MEVIDSVAAHVGLLKTVFDFDTIKRLLGRSDFSFVYDSMSGVQGPYAKAVFCHELGASEASLLNAEPKDDFGGGHADPNLTYAHVLTEKMGVDKYVATQTNKKQKSSTQLILFVALSCWQLQDRSSDSRTVF